MFLPVGFALLPVGCSAGSSSNPHPSGAPVIGMPEAEVFDEILEGPSVLGDYVTLAPQLAELPPGNRHHELRIDVLNMEIEVADDVRYRAWTFGGTVPAPVVHVREGDRVTFTMANRSGEEVSVTAPHDGVPFFGQIAADDYQRARPVSNPMGHSMDFHAGMVAADDKWRTIAAGQTIRFDWVANHPGVFLYHCGTPSVLQHVAMGQYGAVVVSPREGFPTDVAVARVFVLIQSEFYLAPGTDGLHAYDEEAAHGKQPTVVAFNGHRERHVRDPLEAQPGERVRIYLLNAGPNDVTTFHVIGTILDRVWYEGDPANEWRGMQSVLLGPSNGAVVEFVVPEPGRYVFVDHSMADMEKGAAGHLVAR